MILQLFRGVIAVATILIGLQVMGAILAVVLDTDDLFFLVLGLAIALAISGAAIYGIAIVANVVLSPLAAGWLGMAVGRHPHGYGADDNNGQQALGSLLLIGLLSFAGYSIWQSGRELLIPFRVVTGLLLIGGGWVVGLAGLVPRIYFALRPGEAEAEEAPEGRPPTLATQAQNVVLALALCAFTGMGFAKCTIFRVGVVVDDQARIVMPFGDWVMPCKGKKPRCVTSQKLVIRPDAERGRRLRLISWGSCSKPTLKDSKGRAVNPLSDAQYKAFGIPQKTDGKDVTVFDQPAAEEVTIRVDSNFGCSPYLRYQIEPSSSFGQRAP